MTFSLPFVKKESARFLGVFAGSFIYVLLTTTINAALNSPTPTPSISPASSITSTETPSSPTTPPTPESEDSQPKESCSVSETFTPQVRRWSDEICRWSDEHNMDPDLIATIMQIESCGNHTAISSTGVRGLFQVTGANLDGQNPYNPNVSMAKGPGKVLKAELKAAAGNVVAALAGYNGGGYARQYINGDISFYQFYRYLRNHPSGYWWSDAKARAKINEVSYYAKWANIFFESKTGDRTTLQAWLDKGGQRLCDQAELVSKPQNLAQSH